MEGPSLLGLLLLLLPVTLRCYQNLKRRNIFFDLAEWVMDWAFFFNVTGHPAQILGMPLERRLSLQQREPSLIELLDQFIRGLCHEGDILDVERYILRRLLDHGLGENGRHIFGALWAVLVRCFSKEEVGEAGDTFEAFGRAGLRFGGAVARPVRGGHASLEQAAVELALLLIQIEL